MKKYLFSVMFAFAMMIPLFSQAKADSVPETKTESTELNILKKRSSSEGKHIGHF